MEDKNARGREGGKSVANNLPSRSLRLPSPPLLPLFSSLLCHLLCLLPGLLSYPLVSSSLASLPHMRIPFDKGTGRDYPSDVEGRAEARKSRFLHPDSSYDEQRH